MGRIAVGGGKRTKEQQKCDVIFCTDLFLKGYTYRQIAERLNTDIKLRGLNYHVSHVQVYKDMQSLLIEWKRQQFDNIDAYITQELLKLDRLEVEAWEAWEASKNMKTTYKERTNDDVVLYREETRGNSVGDPQFLNVLLNIQQRRAKLLGLDSPTKIALPGNSNADDGKPKYDAKALPEELLFTVADKLQSAEFERIIEEKKNGKENKIIEITSAEGE